MNNRSAFFSSKYISLALLITLSGIVSSCLPPRPSAECREFYDLAPKQREEKVRTSSGEEQLELYLCGMYQEPPTDFSSIIADKGEEVIPFLLERLKTEKSETRQDLFIRIFEGLAIKKRLHGRQDVFDELKRIVSAMKSEEIKRTSEQRLKFIEDNIKKGT